MADDIDDNINCFSNVILQKCRLSAGGCGFAALRVIDQARHVVTVHKTAFSSTYFDQHPLESLPVGTTLLKCRLCDMIVADLGLG
jgi:hypothetical protein